MQGHAVATGGGQDFSVELQGGACAPPGQGRIKAGRLQVRASSFPTLASKLASGRLKKGNHGQIRPTSAGPRMNLSPVPGAPLVLRLLLRGEGKSFSQIAISMRRSCFASDVMRSRHDAIRDEFGGPQYEFEPPPRPRAVPH